MQEKGTNKNGLPEGWNKVKVSAVANLLRGISYTKDVTSTAPFDDSLPVLRANNINGALNFEDLVYVPRNLVRSEQLIKKGDIIFAMSSGSKHLVGKSAIAEHDYEASYGAFCGLVRAAGNIDKRYLAYVFRNSSFRRLISAIAKGTNINNLKREHILDFEFPLPPLSHQYQIVARLEELFSELDKSIEQLKTAQQQLKVYRQSVLQWAFEGKLTGQNRGLNGLVDDADSLTTIKKEISAIPSSAEIRDSDNLPEGWKWVKLGDLIQSSQNGLYKPATKYGNGVKILRIDGFYDGSILEDYKYKRLEASEEEIEKYVIETGDLLINRVNSIEYLGKCGLAKSFAEPTVFESNIMRIKLNQTVADSSYVSKYLSSKRGLTELRKNAKHAVNQASINQTDVANVLLPLAPLNQQQQIIKEIETRLSVADKLEETISQSLQQAEALRQSILKQAFEGKLK